MHPALSAAIAASAAGSASGLLALLGLMAPGEELPKTPGFGFFAFLPVIGGLAAALVHTAGLRGAVPAAPAEHVLWLARTRLLLALNLPPAILFAFGWTVLGTAAGAWRGAGLIAAVLGVLTLFAHARVYVAVPTVAAWHNRWVVPNFLAIGLLAGALWLNALVHVFAEGRPQIALLSVVALFFAFYVKRGHWREIDRTEARRLLAAAEDVNRTGGASVPYYLPSERTRRLRRTAFILMLAAPLVLELVGMGRSAGLAGLCAVAAALSGAAGIAVERWLFFTDAATTGTLVEPSDPIV